jgi:transcriptional regulator with XRE-family HTH domain
VTDETADERLGANLSVLREGRKLRQSDLAKLMNERGHAWHQSTVGRVEAGRQAVRVSEAEALASIFEITIEVLIRPTAEMSQLMMLDEVLGNLHQSRMQVTRAVTRLLRATDAAERSLGRARESSYPRVAAEAGELAAELADSDLDAAVAQGIWTYKHPEGDDGHDEPGRAGADAEREPRVDDQQ